MEARLCFEHAPHRCAMSHSSSTSSDVGVRRYFEAACVKRPYGRCPAPQNDDGTEIEIYCVYSNEVGLIRSKATVMKWPYYGVEWGLSGISAAVLSFDVDKMWSSTTQLQ